MSEKYGTSARIVQSIAATPVSTATSVVFIGYAPIHLVPGWSSHKDDLISHPIHITSLEQYERTFGPVRAGSGAAARWTLTDAAHAALNMQHISSAYFINSFDPGDGTETTASVSFTDGVGYLPAGIGDEAADSASADGILVDDAAPKSVELVGDNFKITLESGTGTAEHAVKYKKIAHPASVQAIAGNAATQSGVYAVLRMKPELGLIANVICTPRFSSDSRVLSALEGVCEKMNGQWGGFVVADAAQASAQVAHGCPVASQIEKTATSGRTIQCWPSIRIDDDTIIAMSAWCAASYALVDADTADIPMRSIGNRAITGARGSVVIDASTSAVSSVSVDKPASDDLQYKGLVVMRNIGGGQYRTWGDHTAAFSNGVVDDELNRFDSRVRVQLMIGNRFQQKYAGVIDEPLTLAKRNEIIAEEDSYLDYLRSQGALVGDNARCAFSELNTPDGLGKGEFIWDIFDTVTPPLKSAEVRIAYTDAGLSAYYTEE